MLASLGGGHLNDLARSSFQHNKAIFAQGWALHGVGGGCPGITRLEVQVCICHACCGSKHRCTHEYLLQEYYGFDVHFTEWFRVLISLLTQVPTVFLNAVEGSSYKRILVRKVTGRILIWKLWFVGKIKLIAAWTSSTSIHWFLLCLIIKSSDKTGIYVSQGHWNSHWWKTRAGCHSARWMSV